MSTKQKHRKDNEKLKSDIIFHLSNNGWSNYYTANNDAGEYIASCEEFAGSFDDEFLPTGYELILLANEYGLSTDRADQIQYDKVILTSVISRLCLDDLTEYLEKDYTKEEIYHALIELDNNSDIDIYINASSKDSMSELYEVNPNISIVLEDTYIYINCSYEKAKTCIKNYRKGNV